MFYWAGVGWHLNPHLPQPLSVSSPWKPRSPSLKWVSSFQSTVLSTAVLFRNQRDTIHGFLFSPQPTPTRFVQVRKLWGSRAQSLCITTTTKSRLKTAFLARWIKRRNINRVLIGPLGSGETKLKPGQVLLERATDSKTGIRDDDNGTWAYCRNESVAILLNSTRCSGRGANVSHPWPRFLRRESL